MNTSKMLRACEAGRHWEEAAGLYAFTGDYDQAVKVQMEHSGVAFKSDTFLDAIPKVRNLELLYMAITFYAEEEAASLMKLLTVLAPKLDASRVVHLFKKKSPEVLPLILPYLRNVQSLNNSVVNEAVNSLLIEMEDAEGLRESIGAHDSFDQVGLAQRLEKHELLEFRRVAALLYKTNKRWDASIALSKRDAQYKDAIDTASDSGESALAESLLNYFITKGDTAAFSATLYTCYELIRPDVAMEAAWRARCMDFVMPFMLQYIRDTNNKIADLEKRVIKPAEEQEAEAAANAAANAGGLPPPTEGGFGYGGMLQIADTAYNAGIPGGYGIMPGMPAPGMGFGGIPAPQPVYGLPTPSPQW
jgi:clathrin heavy chain